MANVMIWNLYDRFLLGFASALMLICAIQYLNKARKTEDINEKLIISSYAFIFLGITLGVIFFYLSELQIHGIYINQTFYGNFENVNLLYDVFIRCGYVSCYAGLSFFFYAYEKISKHSKYFLTIMNSTAIIIVIVIPFSYLIEFMDFYSIIMFVSFMYIMFKYSKWASIDLKAVSSFILFGSILILVGVGFLTPTGKLMDITPLVFGPILLISGTLICLAPAVINPKFFSQGLTYWKLYGIITFVINSVILTYFLLNGFPFSYIVAILVIALYIIYYDYYMIRTLKAYRHITSESKEVSKEKQSDILRVWTRPQNLTEEEVSVSKEKKICLVCKGKVARFNFICPDCGAFYCEKCARTLSDLENMCWVCDTVFDESKPVKPIKKEEEEIEIEEKMKGKGE